MIKLTVCLAVFLFAAMAQAEEMRVSIDGKEIRMDRTMLNREITKDDRDKGNQTSALACSFSIYNLLAKGDIQGAAKLSVSPSKAAEKWTNYRERIGDEDFKKMMADYFSSGNVAIAELYLGDDTMLVVKTEDGPVAQFYQKRGGKYLMTDEPTSGKILGRVLNMLREGRIRL